MITKLHGFTVAMEQLFSNISSAEWDELRYTA